MAKKRIVLLVLFLAVILTSCSFDSLDKLWVKSEGWSRALKLGETGMSAQVPIAYDDLGNLYFILFPRVAGEDHLYTPQIVIVGRNGEVEQKIDLEMQISKPADADIILNDDSMDLYWIENSALHTIHVGLDGVLLGSRETLSGDDHVYSFFLDQIDGNIVLTYTGSRDNPGAYALVGTNGIWEKTLLDPSGFRVHQIIDEDHQLHLIWINYPFSYGDFRIFYLKTDPGRIQPEDKHLIYEMNVTPAIRIDGPALGFDEELGYIFWSKSIVSGLDAGVQNSYIQYFPIDDPGFVRPPMPVYVPFSQNLKAEEYYGAYFQTGNRVFAGGGGRTPFQDSISTLEGRYPELAFAFRSQSEHKWRDVRSQVNVAYFQDGVLTTYQPLSYTSTESSNPKLILDQENNLLVSWLEKSNLTYNAYFSTTDPVRKSSLDLVSQQDYLYLVAEGVFGILAGAVLSPFAAAVWGGIGMIGLLITVVLGQFHKPIFRTIGEYLGMAAGIFVFWWIKLATLPGLNTGYVPFSAWVPRIPEGWEQPLVIGIPILIGLISAFVAWRRTYGRDSGSAVNFHLLYAGMDSLLSCAVYGILIYGAF